MYTKFIYDKNGGAFWIRKASFSPSRRATQSRFEKRRSNPCFIRVSIKERSWLRFIERAGSKRNTFPAKVTFFQIVILNARLWFAFSPPSLCTRLRHGIDI